MKKIKFLLIVSVLLAIVSCTTSNPSDVIDSPIQRYNVVIVLDGTDRLQCENVVPVIGQAELDSISAKMLKLGIGTIYVTFVDNNSDNNQTAILDFDQIEPEKLAPRPSYVPVSEYRKQYEKYRNDSTAYENNKHIVLSSFKENCTAILEQAYSEKVATNKRGSDVFGAINQAYRLQKPNMSSADKNIIILISDGVDNVGKELQPKPEGVELYLVNGTVSKHPLDEIVDQEYVTINQVIKHAFK